LKNLHSILKDIIITFFPPPSSFHTVLLIIDSLHKTFFVKSPNAPKFAIVLQYLKKDRLQTHSSDKYIGAIFPSIDKSAELSVF